MRVQGNINPNPVSVTDYRPIPGTAEIRLRENINAVTVSDEVTGQSVSMYEYDEYTFILPDREGLRDDIEANIADWLITGRTLEVNQNASILQDMKTALAVLGVVADE